MYARWSNMRARCYRRTHPNYRNYGARGITVDERLQGYPEGFNAFVADMGASPAPGMTIDRIDNDGPYSPENCRWVPRREQLRNTRRTVWVTIGDMTMCVADWAQQLGVHPTALKYRAGLFGGYEAAVRSYDAHSNGSLRHLSRAARAEIFT
jgi:hypothetical protein